MSTRASNDALEHTSRKVLIVEDDQDIRDLICLHVTRNGHQAEALESAEAAIQKLTAGSYSLIVLDWMLPGIDGLQLLKRLRSTEVARHIPVLMVTAKGSDDDVVLGLEAGADDYLVKPFEPRVLMARVNALLRRFQETTETGPSAGSPGQASQIIRVGRLVVDPHGYEVTCEARPVNLTRSEFRLLLALLENRGRVLTRSQLISQVQGSQVSVVDRAIDTHVFGLRHKLGNCADLIETIRGVGYRIRAGE